MCWNARCVHMCSIVLCGWGISGGLLGTYSVHLSRSPTCDDGLLLIGLIMYIALRIPSCQVDFSWWNILASGTVETFRLEGPKRVAASPKGSTNSAFMRFDWLRCTEELDIYIYLVNYLSISGLSFTFWGGTLRSWLSLFTFFLSLSLSLVFALFAY